MPILCQLIIIPESFKSNLKELRCVDSHAEGPKSDYYKLPVV